MNRLQRKCVLASTGFHLLLALILFIGPGFKKASPKTEDLPLIDFIPLKTTDLPFSGGGDPNAKPPPVAPQQKPQPQPQPQPPPETKPLPPPPKPEPKPEVKPDPIPPKPEPKPIGESFDPKPEPKRKPLNLKQVVRNPEDKLKEEQKREEENARQEARREAQRRQRLASAFSSAATGISSGVSSANTTVIFKGPGGGGVPYANFLQAVQSVYQRAWRGRVPAGATDRALSVAVEVVIGRDGTVESSRITEPCDNPQVNRAVRATLDAVRVAAPLPDEAKENQRTVTIYFDVEAKKGVG
jgi:TonB family protein